MSSFCPHSLATALAKGLPLLAAQASGTETGTAASHRWAGVAIPLSTGWVDPFLLAIVWLFVVAVVLGPLIAFFRLEPRSPQLFTDDPKVRR